MESVKSPHPFGSEKTLHNFRFGFEQIHPNQTIDHVGKGLVKVERQEMPVKLQVMLNADQDTVITKACKILYKELKNKIYTKR